MRVILPAIPEGVVWAILLLPVASMLTIIPGDDVEQCADLMRPMVALYAGGMGAKGANFHLISSTTPA